MGWARGGGGGERERIAKQRARPILFRRRGILTHRGTRINVDRDFVGRVALFVTQCNGERARLFPLLPSLPPPFSSRSVFQPPYFHPGVIVPKPPALCTGIFNAMCDRRYRASSSFSLLLSSSKTTLSDAKIPYPVVNAIRIFRRKI